MAITRTTVTDDSGAGTDGTILNQAWLTTFYDTLDARWSEVSTTSTGNQDNFDFTQGDVLRCNNATTITLRGLLAPASPAKAGKRLVIVSVGAGSVVLNHQDTNSTAANRIITPHGQAITITRALLVYDDTTDRWRVVSASSGVESLNRQTGDVANGTTVETDLKSYSLPAAKLALTGDSVVMECWGTYAANGNTKTVRLYFGATVVATRATTQNGGSWWVRAVISRTGAATQVAWGGWDGEASGTYQTTSAPTETLSGAVTMKCTGQSGTASDDVVAKNFVVRFEPTH